MPPLPPDPYKALGVLKSAPITDIRTAYRKLVLTCHPDKVHDPTQKAEKLEEFQKIQHAYELLSDDKERAKYDQQVTLMELRKAVPKNVPNTSAPRTPKTHTRVRVYTTTEPRPSPYAQSPPQAGARVYAQYSPATNEEFGFADDEGTGRSAKRTQSYEKGPSRKEKELEEEKERERADRARRRREKEEAQEEREKEKEKEREHRERERRLSDKESRKAEKKRQDKERKQAHEEKHRNRSGAYVEEYTSDKDSTRPEKKKSSSRKTRERERERESTPKLEVLVEKTNDQRTRAEEYIKRRANIDRSATADATTFRNSPPSVPTPPPPRDSGYAPPPVPEDENDDDDDDDEEEEPVHHPRAGSRRGSYDPSRSREPGFMHKRSFPNVIDETVHLSTSPGRIPVMAATDSPPRGSLPKSGSFHESPRSAARPIPTMPRSHTFAAGDTHESRHSRGRSRSRFQPQRVPEFEEEDEVEMRQHLKSYRSSRRETPTEPIPIYTSKHYEGRSLGRESSYRDSFDRSPKYFTSSGSSEYIEAAYSSYPRAQYPKVKTAKRYDESEVNVRRYGEPVPY